MIVVYATRAVCVPPVLPQAALLHFGALRLEKIVRLAVNSAVNSDGAELLALSDHEQLELRRLCGDLRAQLEPQLHARCVAGARAHTWRL